jgi:hypothetical protein
MASSIAPPSRPTPSAGACLRSLQETDRWPADHRWTNGQVERMNRTLKTLRGLTPYEFIGKTWTEQPARFTADPTHYTAGPNS